MSEAQKVLTDIQSKVTQEQYRTLRALIGQSLVEKPREGLKRIPLLLPLLGTFGLVTTFYGFEKFLDQTPLVNFPLEMIALGVLILILTGAAATKL